MSHRASLHVSTPGKAVTGWVARRRRRPRSRPAQRAGTVHTQVALALRWLRHRLDLPTLAGEAGLSIATAYRYQHEALEVIAAHAPGLADVLHRAHAAGLPFVCLDGTGLPQLELTPLLWDEVPRRGCRCAEAVSARVQA